jgi:hypothetical protein
MRKFPDVLSLVVLGLFLVSTGWAAPWQAEVPPPPGVFTELAKWVEIRPDDDVESWVVASFSNRLEVNQHVKVGEESSCAFTFHSGLIVRLEPESEVVMVTPPGVVEGSIRLMVGRIRLEGQLPAERRFEIDGSQAVVGFGAQSATRTVVLEMEDVSYDPAGRRNLVIWNNAGTVDVLIKEPPKEPDEPRKVIEIASGTGIEVGPGGVWRILTERRP